MRAAVLLLFGGLAAGYLIFNRPFAKQGFPLLHGYAVYVGEMVLVAVVLADLEKLRPAVWEPLRCSWTFRLLALLWFYGAGRTAADFFQHGWWALRDGAVVGYALLAFAVPALLLFSSRRTIWSAVDGGGEKATAGDKNGRRAEVVADEKKREQLFAQAVKLPTRPASFLLLVSFFGALWAAAVRFRWAENARGEPWKWAAAGVVKVDFLTLAAGAAFWVWAVTAAKSHPFRRAKSPVVPAARLAGCLAAAGVAYGAARLTLLLPTRAVWAAILPMGAALCLVFAPSRLGKTVLGVLAAAAVALAAKPAVELFQRVNDKYALHEKLDFSIDEIEARYKNERLPELVLNTQTTGDPRIEAERRRSLLLEQTGAVGGRAVEWRAAFWLRCIYATARQHPLFGFGFGNNPVNFFRGTPAWPLFEGNLRLRPPNRSPHCVHVTIFTRLGLLGLLLWLGLLHLIFWGTVRTCRGLRRRLAACGKEGVPAGEAAVLRNVFWSGLTVFGVWLLFLWAASFGVVMENPMGGMWFWSLTGILGWWNLAVTKTGLRQEENAEKATRF